MGETEFNARLKDNNTRFTYFVPRDVAWHNYEIRYPSAIKKLFMPRFKYHVRTMSQVVYSLLLNENDFLFHNIE